MRARLPGPGRLNPETRRRIRCRARLALAVWAASAALAGAAERFVYGGDQGFPPHEYLDEAGSPAGFNVDVVRLIARESGRDVEIRLGPWQEQMQAFAAGEIDVMSLAWSAARAERVAFLVQIWTLRQGLLFRPGRERYPASLSELSGEVVGVERDGGIHERLLALPPSQRPVIRALPSHREACLGLLRGELTAVAGGQLSLRYFASRLGLEDTVEVEGDSFGYFLATRVEDRERFAFLAETWARLEGTDAVNKLAERAFALPGPERSLGWRQLLPLVVGLGVVLGLALLWNRTLKRQIEVRTRELRESERRRRQNEKLAVLGNVVGAVAHEVRNPLFAISANVDVLEVRLSETDGARRNLESLRSSVDRLAQLMRDLLDYGRSEGLNLQRSDDLSGIVAGAVANAAPLAESKRVEVRTSCAGDLPSLDLDRERFTRAVCNLVENALQHSPGTGTVDVIVRRSEPGWVEIRVEDDGPGFTPEASARLFEPFFSQRDGGTGLGLAIVERIVSGHRGHVTAENRPQGGAAVQIRLPVPAPQRPTL